MTFRLADVKKTVRARSDGERYLHPKVLEGPAVCAQVSLALSYFASRLGRARHEVDPEMLVRFFGDPKVARGLVACLSATYRWRARELSEVLGQEEVARLAAAGLYTPGDVRLYLYDALNREADGFLRAEREEHLWPLARRLRLTPAKVDQLIALDADENAVLVRVGPVPEPEHIVALYNYHSVDAILRNSIYVDLHRMDAESYGHLAAACDAYGVALTREGDGARLHNQTDLFGSYARAGARLARALYAAAASAPRLLSAGYARVQVPGKAALYELDRATVRALTAGTGVVRCAPPLPGLRDKWDRYRASAGTAGWRLLTAPEPALSSAGLALAPSACRRDETQVLLWPVSSSAGWADARALQAAGLDILPVVADETEGDMAEEGPWARAADGPAGIVAALERHWGGSRLAAGELALEGLLATLRERGFVPAGEVGSAIGCTSAAELEARLRGLDPALATYVPGVGLCSPAFAEDMRKGLRRARRRKAAA